MSGATAGGIPRLIRWTLGLAAALLALLTLLRLGTWWIFARGQLSLAEAWPALLMGLRFDARVVAAVLLPVLLLGTWRIVGVFSGRRGRTVWLSYLAVVSVALFTVYACDFLHYRYLNQRLNASAIALLEDARISAGMVWQSYPVLRILLAGLAVLAGVLAGAAWWHRRSAGTAEETRRGRRIAWFAAVAVAGLVAIFGRLGQYPLRWSDAFGLRNDLAANLALNPVQSLLSSFSFRQAGYDLAQVRAHYPAMAAYLGVSRPDAARLDFSREVPARAPAAGGRRPNVVLVICESFSAYKSSMWGNPLDTTPRFAELCRQGVFFEHCHTPHFGTARGVWATITGLPDVAPVKTASRNPAMVDQHTIINDFTGYRKLYFLGGSTSWANIRGLLTNNIAGLQLFEEDSFKSRRVDVWGISDKSLFLEAHAELARQTEPFFAIIQTAGNHRPYTIAAEDLAEFSRVEAGADELKRGGFESLEELNAFRYMDYAIGKFMAAARTAPYFENTVFVFVGDHGIGGNAGAMFPPAWTEQGLTSYHVPLLFYAPKLLPARRISSVSSMVDILPTVAGVAGVAHRNTTLGRDLLRQEEIDGGRSNAAFIIDHNNKTIGVIHGTHYGYRQLPEGRPSLVWTDFNRPPPTGGETPDATAHGRLAAAFHETARYLLLHNRKPGFSPKEGD